MTDQAITKTHLMTQTEYAAHRGCSKQYVNQLVKQGRVTLINGRVDPTAADAALARDRDPARGTPLTADSLARTTPPNISDQPDSASPYSSFSKARAVREHYRALRERLEYDRLVGLLVPTAEAEEGAAMAGQRLRESLELAADRLGEVIAAKFGLDEGQVNQVIDTEFRATLKDLARRLKEQCQTFREAEESDPQEQSGDTGTVAE